MRNARWALWRKVATPPLVLWAGFFALEVGTHAPADVLIEAAAAQFGAGGLATHAEWHRHVIDDPDTPRDRGLDHCGACLAKSSARAIHTRAFRLCTASASQRLLTSGLDVPQLGVVDYQPPSRAPPLA